MEGYIAQIIMFAGTFAPRGWAFCQGQLIAIAQNTALFSLLGTTYGGNGQTTFALPDLRGRVPVGVGQGPGLPSVVLGQMAGAPTHTLIVTEMPAHNHIIQAPQNASSGPATDSIPNGNFLASDNQYAGTSNTQMNASAIQATAGIAGGSQPHNNMQPYLGMNYIICMEGIYPARN